LTTGEATESEEVHHPSSPPPPPLTGHYTEIEMPPKAAAAKELPKKCKWNEAMDALPDFLEEFA
jgi:hypothetical protein